MKPIVTCIPNFSEGREGMGEAIVDAIRSEGSCRVLRVDRGAEVNRMVVTFVGPPTGVVEAAKRGIVSAAASIDMRKHRGLHIRQGATDVCPLLPIQGISMQDCIRLSEELGEKVGAMGIPVYLYAASARDPKRRSLAYLRQGQYESLEERMKRAEWRPDFGPVEFQPHVGATIIGARGPLIAFNLDLATDRLEAAQAIAFRLRERGQPKRDLAGQICKDSTGRTLWESGLFPSVMAMAWAFPEKKLCQITMNLTDPSQSPLHRVFAEAKRLAEEASIPLLGSEMIGMAREADLITAGRFFSKSPSLPPLEAAVCAVETLGLQRHGFELDTRVLEVALRRLGWLPKTPDTLDP